MTVSIVLNGIFNTLGILLYPSPDWYLSAIWQFDSGPFCRDQISLTKSVDFG